MQLPEGNGLPPLFPLLSFPQVNFPGTIWGPHCPLNLAYTPENLLRPPQLYRFLTTLVMSQLIVLEVFPDGCILKLTETPCPGLPWPVML